MKYYYKNVPIVTYHYVTHSRIHSITFNLINHSSAAILIVALLLLLCCCYCCVVVIVALLLLLRCCDGCVVVVTSFLKKIVRLQITTRNLVFYQVTLGCVSVNLIAEMRLDSLVSSKCVWVL